MKKKFLVAIFAVVMVLLLAVPSCAADVSASVNSEEVNRGDTVTFSVTLSNSINADSGSVALTYDKTVLALVSGAWNLPAGASLVRFDAATELGAFAYESPVALSGAVFSATFTVLDTAAFATTDVKMDLVLKNDSTTLSVTNNKGSVTVLCVHSFTKQDKSADKLCSAATCESPALYYYSCEYCNAKGTTTFTDGSALPHTYDKTVATTAYQKTPASCTESAVYYYSCKCGAKGSETFTSGSSLGHSYSTVYTSDETGHWYACTACGDKKDEAAHVPGAASTCSQAQTCTVCTKELAPTIPHSYTDVVTPPTCSQQGYTTHTCSVCGDVTVDSYVPVSEYVAGDWVIVYEATAAMAGEKHKLCTVCGETLEIKIIPPLMNAGTTPVDTDPVDTDPVDTDPVDSDPVETDPADSDPVVTDPADSDPVVTDPVDSDPVETDPVGTDPVETDPVETDPVETDPETEKPEENGGCGGVIGASAVALMLVLVAPTALVIGKKEND